MTDETADLIAFVRAAGGQVTNRMVLRLCDELEKALEAVNDLTRPVPTWNEDAQAWEV